MHGGESSFSRLLVFMVVSRLRRLSCHRPVGIIILAPLRGFFLGGTSCNGSSAALRSWFTRSIFILMEFNLCRVLHNLCCNTHAKLGIFILRHSCFHGYVTPSAFILPSPCGNYNPCTPSGCFFWAGLAAMDQVQHCGVCLRDLSSFCWDSI